MKPAWVALLCLLACIGAAPASAASATVDRARLSESETLELRIRVDGTGDAEPELGPLEQDFELLSNSRNSRISLINGRGESFTEWVIALAPRRAGELTIPALAVGGERTAPLRITVTPDDAGAAAAPGTQDISLEVLPASREVHVQEQLLLTVRLLHAVDFASGATLDEPAIDGAVVRKLGEDSYEKRIGARRYGVFERRYAVFPQASGELLIPRLQFDASVGGGGSWFDRFGGSGKRVRLRSAEQRIRVLAPEQGASPWLPARLLTLVETWDRSPQELRVGESATRTLTLSASGLTGAQLPALPAGAIDGLRLYPDKPDISDETGEDGIAGTRVERSAVIPTRAGEIELPELRLRWWDTINRRFAEAVVPGRTIRVQGAANDPPPVPQQAGAAPAVPAATADAGATTPAPATGDATALRAWQAACALLAALALFSLAQWRRALRHASPRAPAPPPRVDESARYAALRAACSRNDAIAVPALLLDWSRSALTAPAPRTLAELPRRLAAPDLHSLLEALQRSRYARENAPWSGAALIARLDELRKTLRARGETTAAGALPPLYPTRDGLSR